MTSFRPRARQLLAIAAVVGLEACGDTAPPAAPPQTRTAPPPSMATSAPLSAADDSRAAVRNNAGGPRPLDRRRERLDRRVSAAFAAGPIDIAEARRARLHGRLVEFDATVEKLLRDDLKGAQHQRFLVSVPDAGTLLIAHNIDLAPQVPVALGDRVRIRGLFEWNPKGGVVHWTHHDPRHAGTGGWIRLRGQTYG